MVDADPAGKASPPIRPRQLLEVVGIKSEQVVGIVSERVVGITLDQVVAIKSEWVVGPSWNPQKCPETVRFQGLILVGATGFEHTPIAELIRAFGEPRKCPETETAEDAPATTAGGVAADVWRIAEFLRKIWKIAKNSYNAVVTL